MHPLPPPEAHLPVGSGVCASSPGQHCGAWRGGCERPQGKQDPYPGWLCVPELRRDKPNPLAAHQRLGSGQALMPGPPELSELEGPSGVPRLDSTDAGRPFGADLLSRGLDPGCLRARFSGRFFTSPSLDFPMKKVGAVTASLAGCCRGWLKAHWTPRFEQR